MGEQVPARGLPPLAITTRIWRGLFDISFLLIAGRLFVAAWHESSGAAAVPLLFIGSAVVAFRWPADTLWALFALAPLLSGLAQISLLPIPSPLMLVSSGILSGAIVRRCVLAPASPGPQPPVLRLPLDLLILALLASLGWSVLQVAQLPDFKLTVWNSSLPAYADPYYFLTTSLVWLQGLFFFREIGFLGRSLPPPPLDLSFGVLVSTMLVFVAIQFVWGIPEAWTFFGFQSPYEDISSFGSIAVGGFIFTLATWTRSRCWSGTLCLAAWALCLVISWSRAAWLSAGCLILCFAALSLPRRILLVIAALGVAGIGILNSDLVTRQIHNQGYLARVSTLFRIENPALKDPTRVDLYRKAIGMIRDRPVTGHGIGSFYRVSVKYARPDDPYGPKPDFAHNVFLQLAAEQGVFVSASLLFLFAMIGWRGIRAGHRQPNLAVANSQQARVKLGAILAAGAYLLTGLTGNSLNVYASNQIFLWGLLAAVAVSPSFQNDEAIAQSQVLPNTGHDFVGENHGTN